MSEHDHDHGHDHGHDHDHDHGHDHDDSDAMTLSVQIANQVINTANSHMEEGMRVDIIAAGLRHAAANFSAFAHHRTVGPEGTTDEDLSAIVEDFLSMFEYYLDRHAPQGNPQEQPGAGLQGLIDQAKKEV